MKRKIFISINLPDKAKKRLVKATEAWRNLPIKWVRERNLHVTLSFLGYISDDELYLICQKTREASGRFEMFDLVFDRMELGPKEDDPHLVWITGEANESLRKLQEEIEKELGIFVRSKKSFKPHITLGRIRMKKWSELESKPQISGKFPLNLGVETIDVMASDFAGGDNEYALIESCPLK